MKDDLDPEMKKAIEDCFAEIHRQDKILLAILSILFTLTIIFL